MLLNFCLGCKKKKITSQSDGDKLENSDSIENIYLPKTNCKSIKTGNNKTKSTDQVDCQTATSPSSICKFNNIDSQSIQTPIHSTILNDGSVRIKTNAINRALPDIPINDLVNTSINSTASAINRSIDRPLDRSHDRPSIDRSLTPTSNCFNVTNLSINQSNNESTKYNCIPTTSTSTFNPTAVNLNSSVYSSAHNSNLNSIHHNSHNLTNLDFDSENRSLNDLNDLKELNSSIDQRQHHSYARIKDNVVVDSSTENDTDDYYDSTIVGKRNLQKDRITLNVQPANHLNQISVNNQILINQLNYQSNQSNNQLNNQSMTNNEPSTTLYAVSSNLSRITNFESPYHVSTINNVTNLNSNDFINPTTFANSNFNNSTNTVNIYDLSTDEEPATKEVSYNKISVREPLSKVLADRAAAIEHHYTEVYDENNSFYEEIAGSTNSSVTYTKIGDIMTDNQNQLNFNQQNSLNNNLSSTNSNPIQLPPPTTSPPPIPVETSLLTIKHSSSRSTSPMQTKPVLQTFLPNSNLSTNMMSSFASPSTSSQQQPINCEALYTQINKLTKTNKKFSIAQQPININDLYAKVQKNLKIQNIDQTNKDKKIHSSTPDMNNLQNNTSISIKERPPLPPPLDNIPKNVPNKNSNLFTIKSNINLNHQEASISGYSQHTNNSHNNQYSLNVYPQHKRSFSSGSQYQDNTDSDYYETFSKLTDNHNYETVKKKSDDKLNDDKEIIDAGYEIIKNQSNKDSDSDSPCYETISPTKQLDDISEPDYEVIKNVHKIPTFECNRLKRKESDVSTDPGYERLRPDYKKIDESNEDYQFVNRDHFIERL